MTDDRAVQIAIKLQLLGISGTGIVDLLSHYSYDVIERQISFLPYRKAKRKEALLIEAIKNDYSPPKEFYYAQTETSPAPTGATLDQTAEYPDRFSDVEPFRYGTAGAPRLDSNDSWLSATGSSEDLDLPASETEDGPQ